LEKFIRISHHLPYVTHIPSLPAVLKQVYTDLNQQRETQLGRVIFLLSIFAISTYSWLQKDCACGLFSTYTDANNQVSLWVKAAEDVLDIASRPTKATIEIVQGTILLGSVVAHLEGPRRFRKLLVKSIALAQELRLHRIDHPSYAEPTNTIQAEIGRRVWWYLCATDW
jgi:hypothetical protein